SRKRHEIARHDLLDRYLDKALDLGGSLQRGQPLALDARRCLDQGLQLGGRLVRTMFLDESRHDRKDHHRGYDNGGTHVAEKVRNDRERQQQGVERILGTIDEFMDDTRPVFLRDLVQPETLKPLGGFSLVETAFSAAHFAEYGSGIALACGQ